jgi:hypothetical protein
MTTPGGRDTLSYLVRCALPAGHSIIKKDQFGVSYKFTGQIGVAPEWETGACGKDCQEYVSACLLAHINTTGQHVAIWLVGDNPAIGWGQNTDYPYQEGSFFGNIFISPPQALYCNGKDFDRGLVPGRLGDTTGAIYKNPYAAGTTYCKDYCTAADAPHSADGYKACGAWRHVITVWRNFDPNTAYKVCNRNSGKCLDVYHASTSDRAQLIQYHYTGADNQRWIINQISPLNYRFSNVHSGLVLDIAGKSPADGTNLIQYPYNGGPNQMWSFTPTGDGYYKFSAGSNPAASLDVPGASMVDATFIEQWTWTGALSQQWNIVPAN